MSSGDNELERVASNAPSEADSEHSSKRRGRLRFLPRFRGSAPAAPATLVRASSPFSRFARSRDQSRDSSLERGVEGDADSHDASENEEDACQVVAPNNAFEEDSSDSDFDDDDDEDPEMIMNTEANTGIHSVDEVLEAQGPTNEGVLPNMIRRAFSSIASQATIRPRGARKPTLDGSGYAHLPIDISKPVYERNRCSVHIKHGDPDEASRQRKRSRSFFVASDLSGESEYAIEWAIGTVLRDGDECLIVSVMESETKLDPEEGAVVEDKWMKVRAQRERQETALALQRIAISLLEKTRLHVRVTCQAVHAKNARHMLVDLIDWQPPTMVIIGSRGLGKLKGMILGSTSHYLVRKSSVPVMVARRRLQRGSGKARSKRELDRQPRVGSLADAQIEKESHAGEVKGSDASQEDQEDDESSSSEDEEDEKSVTAASM